MIQKMYVLKDRVWEKYQFQISLVLLPILAAPLIALFIYGTPVSKELEVPTTGIIQLIGLPEDAKINIGSQEYAAEDAKSLKLLAGIHSVSVKYTTEAEDEWETSFEYKVIAGEIQNKDFNLVEEPIDYSSVPYLIGFGFYAFFEFMRNGLDAGRNK